MVSSIVFTIVVKARAMAVFCNSPYVYTIVAPDLFVVNILALVSVCSDILAL